MATVLKISIEKDNSTSKSQLNEENNVIIEFGQKGIMLTPKKYKQLFEIVNKIKELVVQVDS
ncbi:hypothetical protein [Empedobacter sp. UBA5637]|uniref:hypothetical protein n=1 Tax=Empedobacter sp. UBA5637 TaxID=1946442 RepID=UPI0025BB7BD8|nr:hypothetical protein [Empedobacter sp. UBA5637]